MHRTFIFMLVIFSLLNFGGKDCTENITEFVPVRDLHGEKFNNYPGGKYPNGSNTIPLAHYTAGIALLASGNTGDIVADSTTRMHRKAMLVLGFSTAAMTGRTFRNMHETMHPDSPLRIIIGAQGGQDINKMLHSESRYWQNVDSILQANNFSDSEVQIIWLSTGDVSQNDILFPDFAEQQTEKFRQVLTVIKNKYPGSAMVYISDRPYAGYVSGQGVATLAEPSAYYTSWSVKWLIGRQIEGSSRYSMDALPYIDWGPALWTNGTKGDTSGYFWDCRDAGKGGIHPTARGRMKEAARLYHFFTTHPVVGTLFR